MTTRNDGVVETITAHDTLSTGEDLARNNNSATSSRTSELGNEVDVVERRHSPAVGNALPTILHRPSDEAEGLLYLHSKPASKASLRIACSMTKDEHQERSTSTKHLHQDDPTMLPKRPRTYSETFLLALLVGVVLRIIYWVLSGSPPDPRLYSLGIAVRIALILFLQACYVAFRARSTGENPQMSLDEELAVSVTGEEGNGRIMRDG